MKEWFIENNVDKYSFEQNVETDEGKILQQTDPLDDWIQTYIIPKIHDNNYLQDLEVSPTELMNSYIAYCKKSNLSYNNVNKLWASKHIYIANSISLQSNLKVINLVEKLISILIISLNILILHVMK